MSLDTVGTLLADIATSFNDGLRIFSYADKSQWGPDEHGQVHVLEEALDDAKKDFQELSPLVNGQFYYQNDRNTESLEELRILHAKLQFHVQNFKDWAKSGGPINPTWAKDTADLRRELHRAQCRAARRIFGSERETAGRCLGAFLVHRKQRTWGDRTSTIESEFQRRHLEELVACNSVGKFERFGETDIAFVCDYCDGYIVWDDLDAMPSIRTSQEKTLLQPIQVAPPTSAPNWQATGFSASTREEKEVVFAPIAIANHVPPEAGAWQAPILCPYCEDENALNPGDDGIEEVGYSHDEGIFEDLMAFHEHLAWQHTAIALPSIPLPSSTGSCRVM